MPRNSRSVRKNETSVRNVSRRSRKFLIRTVDRMLEDFSGSFKFHRPIKLGDFKSTVEMERAYERLRNVAEALRIWHSSDDYLGDDGIPRPLSSIGPRSIASLATEVSRGARERKELAADLKKLESIRLGPDGYAPTKRSAVLGVTDSLALTYATLAVSRLVETITHNFSGKGSRRYERQLSETRIRAADVPAFLCFVEEQGQSLVDSVDDWLSKRVRTEESSDDRLSVSLGAFAWVAESPARLNSRRQAIRRALPRK